MTFFISALSTKLYMPQEGVLVPTSKILRFTIFSILSDSDQFCIRWSVDWNFLDFGAYLCRSIIERKKYDVAAVLIGNHKDFLIWGQGYVSWLTAVV